MIFGLKQYRLTPLTITSLLTFLLTACGGGSSEGGGPLGNGNSSAPAPNPTSAAVSSSAPASSAPLASSSSAAPKTSSSAPSSSPVQATKSSAPAQSSYARSSRASSSLADFDDDIIYPEEPEEFFDLPPTAPRNLKLEAISSHTAIISWSPATDDVALSRYEIRRDGVAIGTSVASILEYEDTNLSHNTYYTYTVRAIDTAGNRSNFSNAVIAKTTAITSNTSSSHGASSAAAISSSTATSNSSAAISSNNSTSSSSTATSASSTSPASASASSQASDNLARLAWVTPSQRENGDYLELNEIGGYELRYKPINSSVYIREIISDRHATNYETANALPDGLFQIAVFDTNGLYSRFITLSPQ